MKETLGTKCYAGSRERQVNIAEILRGSEKVMRDCQTDQLSWFIAGIWGSVNIGIFKIRHWYWWSYEFSCNKCIRGPLQQMSAREIHYFFDMTFRSDSIKFLYQNRLIIKFDVKFYTKLELPRWHWLSNQIWYRIRYKTELPCWHRHV